MLYAKRSNIPIRLGTFAIGLAFIGAANVAHAQSTGTIEVCKVSSATNPVVTGTPFTFTVTPTPSAAASGSVSPTVPTGAPGSNDGFGNCSPALTVAAGPVTVTEALPSGIGLAAVTAQQFNGTTNSFTSLTVTRVGTNGVSFTLPAGTVSGEVLVTFTNQVVPTGFLEICKDSAPNVSGSFSFTVSGVSAPVVVPIGACSLPIQVPAGAVTITEAISAGSVMTGASAFTIDLTTGNHTNELVSTNLPAQTVIATVLAGGINLETHVHIQNTAVFGQLKICKVAGSGVNPGTAFQISAAGTPYSVLAGVNAANPESCVVDGTFPVGTTVPVVEMKPTTGAATFSTTNVPAITGACAVGTTSCTANVVIAAGITEVTFTNTVPAPGPPITGQLKVCKLGGTGIATGTLFAFTITATVNGGTTTTPYSVPANSCIEDGTFPVGTSVTVSETLSSSAAVSAIVANVNGANTTLPNPGTGVATFAIGAGTSEVTFTNIGLGTVNVCKIAGTGVTAGTSFGFTASGTGVPMQTFNVAAGAAPGNCSARVFPIGTVLTITENASAGTTVSAITGGSNANLTNRTVNATVASAPTTVTFTNVVIPAPPLVTQACSPGFFKTHPNIFPTASNVTLSALGFTGSLAGVSVQDALSLRGGGIDALARAAAAAFLNEVASGISLTTAESDIKALVLAGNQTALDTRTNDSSCTIQAGPATGMGQQ